MAKFLDEVLKTLLPKVANWIRFRYFPPELFEADLDRECSFLHRFWTHNKPHILGVDMVVLLSCLSTYLVLVQLGAVSYFITGPTVQEKSFWIGQSEVFWYSLQFPVYLLLLALITLIAINAFNTKGTRKRWGPLALFCASLFLANTSYSFVEGLLARQDLHQSLDRGQAELQGGNLARARRLFGYVLPYRGLPEQELDIIGKLAQVEYKQKNYGMALEGSCLYLALAARMDLAPADELRQVLRRSTYYLRVTDGISKTLNLLDSLSQRYGRGCSEQTSLFWTAIHPGMLDGVSEDPFKQSGPWWEKVWWESEARGQDPRWGALSWWSSSLIDYSREKRALMEKIYSEDVNSLTLLLEQHPDEQFADIALFLVGRYVDVIVRHQKSEVLDRAYYAWGLQAFEERKYREAIRRYSVFLAAFPKHEWRDDALWRIAKAYMGLGQHYEALRYLLLAKSEPNRDGLPYPVCLQCDIAYVVDIALGPAELRHYLDYTVDPDLNNVVEYSLAEHLLADGNYEEALLQFEKVCRQDTMPIGKQPEYLQSNEVWGMSACAYKLDALRKIFSIRQMPAPDSVFNLAELFLRNPRIFLNPLSREQTRLVTGGVPRGYYMKRNSYARGAELLRQFLQAYPDDRRSKEALLRMAQAFDKAASNKVLEDPDVIEELRQASATAYRALLRNLQNDSPEFDEVFEAIGAVYLHRPTLGEPWLRVYTQADVEGLRREYLLLADEYPAHHLANNALNWVAWSYSFVANLYPTDSTEYEENYRKALETYRRIVMDYPFGRIAQNARDNVPLIEQKLSDPAKRLPVPEERWARNP